MKLITSTSAAVIVAVLGLVAMTPAAFAQAGPGMAHYSFGIRGHYGEDGMLQHRQFDGMRGGTLALVCSEQGAEGLEHMFVAISHRVELTAEQAPLFDALKTAALTAQTSFADTCATLLPETSDTAEVPDLVERLQTRIKVDEAHVAALSKVLPSLEAFYGSLTDEQKANLDIGAEMRSQHFGWRQGNPDPRPGQHRLMMRHNG